MLVRTATILHFRKYKLVVVIALARENKFWMIRYVIVSLACSLESFHWLLLIAVLKSCCCISHTTRASLILCGKKSSMLENIGMSVTAQKTGSKDLRWRLFEPLTLNDRRWRPSVPSRKQHVYFVSDLKNMSGTVKSGTKSGSVQQLLDNHHLSMTKYILHQCLYQR